MGLNLRNSQAQLILLVYSVALQAEFAINLSSPTKIFIDLGNLGHAKLPPFFTYTYSII
jgi:hypothetical protein